MKTTFLLSLLIASFPLTASCDDRQESLGPLVRSSSIGENLPGLFKIYGNPKLGLPAECEESLQRISDKLWFAETKLGICVLEPDFQSGQITFKETLNVKAEWCASPDGTKLFASRPTETAVRIYECFELSSGKSLWTAEAEKPVVDAIFTPDGSQLVVLHGNFARSEDKISSSVTWYDAQSGEGIRRVRIPGELHNGSDIGNDFLSFAGKNLYVSRPSKNGNNCYLIEPENNKPIHIFTGEVGSDTYPNVLTDGTPDGLVAYFTDDFISIFEAPGTSGPDLEQKPLFRIPLDNPGGWSRPNNLRFSPDGKTMVSSTHGRIIVFSTENKENPIIKTIPSGSPLGDFTSDGRHFLIAGNAGGTIYETTGWTAITPPANNLSPHCCPVTEAISTTDGKLIISCDPHSIIAWSENGTPLASLINPPEDRSPHHRMQSLVVAEKAEKIYACNGLDYLEWDLEEITRLANGKSGALKEIPGRVVFADGKRGHGDISLKTISMDAAGNNVITADQYTIRFRPTAPSDPIVVKGPADSIAMFNRAFTASPDAKTVYAQIETSIHALDVESKKAAVQLNGYNSVVKLNSSCDIYFTQKKNGREGQLLSAFSLADKSPAGEPMKLPPEWRYGLAKAVVSNDGHWIFGETQAYGKHPIHTLIDWKNKSVAWSGTLPWTANSYSFSPDSGKLILGSVNRGIYVLDVEKVRSVSN